MSATTAVSTEVRINDESLAAIKSMDDVTALFRDMGIVPESIEDYGNGFRVVKDKNSLVGVPFVVIEWRFNEGDYTAEDGNKAEYVAAYVVTGKGDKHVLVDGGTGINKQLALVTSTRLTNSHSHPQHGLLVSGGLTKSEYTYTDEKGHEQPAVTFYLSE